MAILLATVAALTYGIADYCGGRASRQVNSTAVAFGAQFAGLVLVAALLPVFGDPFPVAHDVWWSLVAALASGTGLVAFYRALAGGSMTVAAPITAVVSAIIPVFVGLAQGERPARVALAGVALAAASIALITGAGSLHVARPSTATLALAVVGGVGFAMVFVALDATSPASGVWPLVIDRLGALPLIAVMARGLGEPLRIPRRLLGLVAVGGVFDMSANFAYLGASNRGMLAVVATVSALYPASTVCLAVVLDKERLAAPQRIGLLLAAGSLALVAAGRV